LFGQGATLMKAYLLAAGLTELADRIDSATIDSTSFSAVAAVNFDRRVPSQNSAAIGDHCAMVPPFTGNGMAMAFQSAEMAFEPVLAYTREECNWSETCLALHRSQTSRFRLRLASAHWMHPYLLQPAKQRWLAAADRIRLLPFRPLYAALH
jgi:flavin-dependent dehydrogenase